MYVDEAVAEGLEPERVGYRSVNHPDARDPLFAAGARRFRVGSANPAPHVALPEAMELLSAVGLDMIKARIQQHTDRLISGIPGGHVCIPIPPESGLVSIDVAEPAATLEQKRKQEFVVRNSLDEHFQNPAPCSQHDG